jgi:hypothetical protein
MPEFRPRIESNEADGMRNRTKIAIFPARARAGALALLVALWPGASGAARADSFFLRSGEPIDGSIVQATRNTLIIRRGIGGMHQTSIRDIEEVRIDLAQGEQISGQLLGWAEGVYRIRLGGEEVRIGEGRILSRAPLEAPPSRTPPRRAREVLPVETAAAPAAARTIGVTAVAANAEMPIAEVAPAPKVESDSQTVALKASVDPAEAGASRVVFRIELSRIAEQTVVLIYGTVDGTARAGTDYEPQQGVLTLAPGTTRTQVRVPLIDHGRPRDDARFELFLTADPKVVRIAEPRIAATIPGES